MIQAHLSETGARQTAAPNRRMARQNNFTSGTVPAHHWSPLENGPPHQCHTMSIVRFALRPSLVEEHAINGTIIATFTNARASAFALNWARGLNSLGLKTMVGISQRLGPATEESLRAAGAGLFCADGAQMQRNGQAGRWAEAISLLRAGYHVLLSDSDIGWLRNPLPYFAAAKLAHPTLDFAMLTDRVFNGYSSEPLPLPAFSTELKRARRRTRLEVELELEGATENAYPSLNIGVIFFYRHALPALSSLLAAFSRSVERPDGSLAPWDQEPINQAVLQPRRRTSPFDRQLVLVHGGHLSLGVLPMPGRCPRSRPPRPPLLRRGPARSSGRRCASRDGSTGRSSCRGFVATTARWRTHATLGPPPPL